MQHEERHTNRVIVSDYSERQEGVKINDEKAYLFRRKWNAMFSSLTLVRR